MADSGDTSSQHPGHQALQALQKVGPEMAQAMQSEEVARTAAKAAAEILSVELGAVVLKGESTSEMSIFGQLGDGPLGADLKREIRSFLFLFLTRSEVLSLETNQEIEVLEDVLPGLAGAGIRRLLLKRLGNVDTVLGLVVAGKNSGTPFSQEQHYALDILVSHASMPLHRIRWHRTKITGAEQVDEESEGGSLFRRLVDQTGDGIFVLDPSTWKFLHVNQSTSDNLRYSRVELHSMVIWDIAEKYQPENLPEIAERYQPGEIVTTEGVHRRKDGSLFPAEVRVGVHQFGGRRLLLCVSRDITLRRQAELMLKAEKERFQKIFAHSNDAIFILDPAADKILDANEKAFNMLEYSREELLAKSISDIHPDEMPQLQAFGESVFSKGSGWTNELTCLTRSGNHLPAEISASVLELDGRTCMLALVRDISERRKAEEALMRLNLENSLLQEEIKIQHEFDEMVGSSRAIRKVFQGIERVAGTDSTVLIRGETGTGKELVARAIHDLSGRKNRRLVTVNCVALPASLIESELFGHEKGAFTGASARKIGRFEMADGGTLFLDEIGDVPLELQTKLLRVLQEGEFERVGGTETFKVDVRVIAATNRDLERAVEEGKYRSDLYYRLNVFPLSLPALRERRDDIPLLAVHFLKKYSQKQGKQLDAIPQRILDALQAYGWPGNIRELENVIERAVILSDGPGFRIGDWLPMHGSAPKDSRLLTMEEMEREHIIKALEAAGWRVSGKNGAAELLGMKSTTLESRIKKLGILKKKRVYEM